MEYHDGGFYINDNSCVSLVFLRSKVFHSKESVLLLEAKASLPRNKKKFEKERTTMNRPEYPRPQFERRKWLNLNGKWQFDFTDNLEEQQPQALTQMIEVPYVFSVQAKWN